MKNHASTRARSRSARGWAGCAAAVVLLGACGGGDEAPEAAVAEQPESTTVTASTAAPATTAPATASATTPPSTAPPTTAPPATAPPTTESCGLFCPLTDEQQTAVDEFLAAYNGGDWDEFVSLLTTDEPIWNVRLGLDQPADLFRYDFIWSDAMSEVWTEDECFDQYGIISCRIAMEDDLHRLLEPYGMEPSVCSISLELVDGKIKTRSYDMLSGCHFLYDGAMHFYGAWFEGQYPDQPPIQGVHYRGWNQTDETAGARAADHLDEWAPVVEEFFSDGKTVQDVRNVPHDH